MQYKRAHAPGLRLDAPAATLPGLLAYWAKLHPQRPWLTEADGETMRRWTWRDAADEVFSIAAWLESAVGHGANVAILSRNRAHWMLADLAVMASGNVSIPIFTTQTADITRYILEQTNIDVLFLGESENWPQIRDVLPAHIQIVRFPGLAHVDGARDWADCLEPFRHRKPAWICGPDDVATIVFTSGTTGRPKGVMHSHRTLISPMERSTAPLRIEQFDRFLSYLPLSHLAEREQIFAMSLLCCGSVHFMESRSTMLRDMRETQPAFFFGAPRIWEQLSHAVLQSFGDLEGFEKALAADPVATATRSREFLGLGDAKTLLSGSAPISRPLLRFYDDIGLPLIEGFGQTEAMGLMCTTRQDMRIGSIGKPVEGVEAKLSDSGELLVRTPDASPGYYKDPVTTAETFVDGWVRTGDRARIDEDGFFFITGRVKDYFKTIHGKYVAPIPIEDAFAKIPQIDQRCLLGRGYSKTVMIATVTPDALRDGREALLQAVLAQVADINRTVEKHARIGAVVISGSEWSIENGFLTTTLKLKRDRVEQVYGERAQELALQAAQDRRVIVTFAD